MARFIEVLDELTAAGLDVEQIPVRIDYARKIAMNPAPTRLRSQPTKLYKVPEPPREIEKPALEEKRYYHTDCKDDHKGHKHKRKDHYCDHPQRK